MKKLIISIIALLGVIVPSITMAQGTGPEPYAVLSESNTKLTFYYNDNKPSDGMSVGPFSSSSYRDWNSYASTITSVVFDESFANCTSLESTAYWFYDCTNLASITGIEHLNTASVKNMNSMFYRCSKLTSLDVSGFNTSSATNMSFMFFNCSRLETLEVSNFDTSSAKNISGMFYNCSGLTSLDVSHFNTANVTNMSGMFRDCRNLSSLDVSGFNTTNVTDMSSMFYWCSGLTSLDVSSFNTDKVTKISAMFNGCSSLTTLNLSNFNTSNVSDLSEMFKGCLGLTSLDLSSFNTDNVTNMKSMFYNCTGLTSLNLGNNFNTSAVTTMDYMFKGCSSMTSLDLSNFVTNNVTNMSGMFSGCSGLTSLNISSFNTGSVKAMYEMFKDCSNLPSINLSNFNTENVTNMYWMFGNCSSLTTINLSSFNTTNVIEMTSMFNGCSGLTSIDVSNFNTANVTNMGGLFSGCSGLTSLNLSNFNTNNVTNMAVLFNGCSGLTILDLNNFNTANVTNMSSMFNGCSGLTELDVSNFNTANVKDMTKMFYDCTSLTSIYVDDNWSTEAVTSSNSMFYNCSNLVGGKGTTYISPNYNATYARIDDPDNGNPGYLTDVADKGKVLEPYAVLTDNDDEITTDAGTIKGKTLTFYYDKQKETRSGMDLTYTPWRDDETKEAITKVVFDASFSDCTSLTTTDSWFNECSNLATIENISNLKTENVTNMSAMFRNCTSLTSIDLENFNTSRATTLDNMFFGCKGLTSLDLSSFNTARVEDMHSMFAGCTKLTTLDLSHFDTSSLTNIQGMFAECELLETVDLSSWKPTKVTDIRYLFNYCTNLTTVYVGSTWNLLSVTDNGTDVFTNCNNIEGGQGTKYRSQYNDYTYAHIDRGTSYPGYFRGHSEPYVEYDNTVLTFYYDDQKDYRDGINIVPFGNNSPSWREYCYNGIKTVVFDESFANCTTLTSTSNWFYNCNKLTTIKNIQNLKTDNVEDMQMMFWRCSSLTNIDLSNFNTENVTNMRRMFEGCTMLESIDVSGFNTGKVTDMFAMFYQCSSLKYIFASSFNTENVTNMQSMFGECTNMVLLDLSSFKTDKVTNMIGMFYESPDLTTIYVGSGWSTAGITDEYYSQNMFLNCKGLEGGKGTHYKEDHIDATYARIDEGENSDSPGYLTDTNSRVPYAVLSDDKTMLIFYYDHNKESRGGMDVGPFNWYDKREWNDYSSKITSVVFNKSFANCTSLTSTSYWFEGFDKLTTITGIENLKTDNVKSMISMFYDCSSLNSLDVRNFKTDNVTNMNQMFRGCSSLTNLDVSRFNTANVVDMSFMFGTCSKLTSLDVTNFKTDNVTDMGGMFDSCSSLTSLDLSSFNTSKVEYDADNYIWGINGMFDGCSSLTTIFVGDGWNVENLTEGSRVFKDCDVLVGGKGTTYDDNHTDYTYAHIDGGPNSDTPGYFTRSGDEPYKFPEPYAVLTDNDEGKTLTFYYDNQKETQGGMDIVPFTVSYSNNQYSVEGREWENSVEDITIVEFDRTFADYTANTSIAGWFFGCKNLKEIHGLANWKTTNVEYMNHAFYDCSSLTGLDIGGLNTDNVTNMQYMFYNCTSLTSINTLGFNTSKVTDMNSMFFGCSSLESINLSGFNTAQVTDMSNMFSGCSKLKEIYATYKWSNASVTESDDMFLNCVTLVGGSGTTYDESHINKEYARIDDPDNNNPGYFIDKYKPYAVLSDNNTVLTFYYDDEMQIKGGMSVGPFSGSDRGWDRYSSTITSVIFDKSFTNCTTLTSTACWFQNFFKLTSITGIEYLKTDNVTDMSDMFWGCSKLESIDVSGFNTTKVTNMSSMFGTCSSLKSLDVTNFKTDNVKNMRTMFYVCSSLTSLDVSNFDTGNVTNMIEMFRSCSALTTITVGSGWKTEAVTGSSSMFSGCEALVGEKGTKFSESHTDAEYARVDNPGNDKPGYFTSGILGDVNGDGFVNIADAQAMVSYILGTYEGTFNVSLADMNNDGVIDIFDVTLVVNITLEDDTNNPSGSRAFTRGDNSQAEMIRLKAEANNIYLSIDEAERFTAFQFDITLPESVKLTGVELAAGTTDHMLKFVKLRGNRYRVVGLSFTNELLATSDGKLIMLQVSDAVIENDVSIDNVLFVTPSNKVVTHIGGIEYNQQAEDDTIYNLSGQKLNVKRQQLSKGVYIINHKKVIIK